MEIGMDSSSECKEPCVDNPGRELFNKIKESDYTIPISIVVITILVSIYMTWKLGKQKMKIKKWKYKNCANSQDRTNYVSLL